MEEKGGNNNGASGWYSKRSYSLAKIISGAFISIIFVFLLVLVLTSNRLSNFQSFLADITERSLPEMTYSANIHNQVNELLYFSSHLANTVNNVGLRMAKQKLDKKIDYIKKQITAKGNTLDHLIQLNIISNELDKLYEIVKRKHALQTVIITKQKQLYMLYEAIFTFSSQITKQSRADFVKSDWVLIYSEIIGLTSNGLIKHRLQGVRQSLSQVNDKIEQLEENVLLLPNISHDRAVALTIQLQQLVTQENGLLPLKMEQLRIRGLTIGRDNFVKNLIDDFLRITEFQSYQMNKKVTDDTDMIGDRIESDIKIIGLVSILMLLVLFWVIAFIEKYFVKRLVVLNKNVIARLHGKNVKLDITGADEIADMANAFNVFADKIEQQKQKLHDLSLTDSLTGLANRRALDQRLSHDLQTAIRSEWPLTIMLMDIDCFKKYNDTYGHVAGDICLQKVAAALSRCQKRSTDFTARYGGEEFLFILPDTHFAGAKKVANKILSEINGLNILHSESDTAPHVTLSIGVAMFDYKDNFTPAQLLEHADHALYKAKLSGKNCSHFYDKVFNNTKGNNQDNQHCAGKISTSKV